MPATAELYRECPEALVVNLAQSGDRLAFSELVRRRQGSVRNLMRRFCHDASLADDLAQDVFVQVWKKLHALKEERAFPGWLRQVALSIWLQHKRRKDVTNDTEPGSESVDGATPPVHPDPGLSMDLDRALSTLAEDERLCVVLSYHEGLSHREIADLTRLPLGTVKSHVLRGSKRLRESLAAYGAEPAGGSDDD